MSLMILATIDGARAAGAATGRLLILVPGVVLLVVGLRRSRTSLPGAQRGKVLIWIGATLTFLGVLALGSVVTAGL